MHHRSQVAIFGKNLKEAAQFGAEGDHLFFEKLLSRKCFLRENVLGTIILNVYSDYSGISQGILWAFASSWFFPDYVAVGMLIVVVGLYLVLRVMWQIYQMITGGLHSYSC